MKYAIILFKSNLKIKTIVISTTMFITSFFIISCSSDDDSITDNSINVQNVINMTLDENPQIGQAIGNINATSNSPMTFTLIQQTFNGAITLNSTNGTLTVGDISFFDFETNPVIQGVVEISNGNESVTSDLIINLNNIDDIASFLTDSKQDYLNAQTGDWLEITEAEYNNLALSLNEVNKVATNDADYDNISNPSTISTTGADTTIANHNGETMPSGSYLFAFKYTSGGVTNTLRAKQSSASIDTGYENIGGNFPMSPATGDHYLVLKASNSPTSAEGFLALYAPLKTFRNYPSVIIHSGNGDTNTLPDLQSNNLFLYQGLSSTQKQWD